MQMVMSMFGLGGFGGDPFDNAYELKARLSRSVPRRLPHHSPFRQKPRPLAGAA